MSSSFSARIFGAVLAAAAVAVAQRGAMGGQRGMGMGGDDPIGTWGHGAWMRGGRGAGAAFFLAVADKLELTDQQKAQLQKMQEEFQLQRVDAKAKIDKAQIQLRSLMRQDKAQEKDVLGAIDELAQLRADLA